MTNEALLIAINEFKKKVEANLTATRKLVRQDQLTDDELLELVDLYDSWIVGKDYVLDELVKHNDSLYRVVQAHTSQSDWAPNIVPALFTKVQPASVIPEFVQPTGEHDAYAISAKVVFEGKVYESLIVANTYSPTVYPAGWKLIV